MKGAMSLTEIYQKCGGAPAISEALGVSRQSVYKWTYVPLDRCFDIERIFGVPAADMRPDIFPADGRMMPRGSYVPKPKYRPNKPLRNKKEAA